MPRTLFVVMVTGLLIAAGGRFPVWAANGPAGTTANPDQLLTFTVNTALRRDRYLDYRDVRADSRRGNVVLTGTVLTDFEKAHATDVAGGVPGVKKVKNEIQVVRDAAGDESNLAERVRARISGDPTMAVTALAIETPAKDTVILHGIVASAGLKARIGTAAAGVNGVGRVENDLEVEQAEQGASSSSG
jgi:hyperosmotically inducible periplasmic protein